jgi:hypothetical protein
MKILALDQSVTATAAVVLNVVGSHLELGLQSVFRPKNSGIYRLSDIREWLVDFIRGYQPTFIVREMHHQLQYGAATQLHALSAVIDLAAHDHDYLSTHNYAIIPVTMWKKFLTGKGNLKKDTAYLVHLNNAIKRSRLLSLSPDFESVDDNCADAICLGVTGFAVKMLRDGQSIDAAPAAISILKKGLDTVFDYGKIA